VDLNLKRKLTPEKTGITQWWPKQQTSKNEKRANSVFT
jgi:hypothetical protein